MCLDNDDMSMFGLDIHNMDMIWFGLIMNLYGLDIQDLNMIRFEYMHDMNMLLLEYIQDMI